MERGSRNLSRESREPDGELLFDRRLDPDETFHLTERKPEQAAKRYALLEAHLNRKPGPEVVDKPVRINARIAQRRPAFVHLENTPTEETTEEFPGTDMNEAS